MMGRRPLLLTIFRVALLVSAFTCATATAFSRPQEDAAGLFQRGARLEQAGRHREALELYRQAVRLDPNFAEGYWGLGSALVGLGEHEEALEAFRQALRLKPELTAVYN